MGMYKMRYALSLCLLVLGLPSMEAHAQFFSSLGKLFHSDPEAQHDADSDPDAHSGSNSHSQFLPDWTGIFRSHPDTQHEGDSDWLSYRDVYKRMIWFDKYGKPKQFITSQLRVIPLEKNGSLEGVRLTLTSKTLQLNLALDPTGRASFPFFKSAYDDNAEIEINRKLKQYAVRPAISIVTRLDGAYDVADLRAACDQARNYLRYTGSDEAHDRKCVGIRFAYAKGTNDTIVRFRSSERDANPLPASEGTAFQNDVAGVFRVFVYRFSDWPEKGVISTQFAPLAISPMME